MRGHRGSGASLQLKRPGGYSSSETKVKGMIGILLEKVVEMMAIDLPPSTTSAFHPNQRVKRTIAAALTLFSS
jgi:hypothetical protein